MFSLFLEKISRDTADAINAQSLQAHLKPILVVKQPTSGPELKEGRVSNREPGTMHQDGGISYPCRRLKHRSHKTVDLQGLVQSAIL